jgi:hypothetical protein
MKAITLHQPWAWAIAHAGKDVENRAWSPGSDFIGQRIAIHAGKKWDSRGWAFLCDPMLSPMNDRFLDRDLGLFRVPTRSKMIFGAIIATACLANIVHLGKGRARFSDWYTGPIGWVLRDIKRLAEPIECRGKQGLWELPEHLFVRIPESHKRNG